MFINLKILLKFKQYHVIQRLLPKNSIELGLYENHISYREFLSSSMENQLTPHMQEVIGNTSYNLDVIGGLVIGGCDICN